MPEMRRGPDGRLAMDQFPDLDIDRTAKKELQDRIKKLGETDNSTDGVRRITVIPSTQNSTDQVAPTDITLDQSRFNTKNDNRSKPSLPQRVMLVAAVVAFIAAAGVMLAVIAGEDIGETDSVGQPPDTGTATPTTTTRPTTTAPTTTTRPTTTLEITSIDGPSTVQCWDGNKTYTAVTNGVSVDSWNWNTGGLGLQTPFDAGPDAVLSFDIDPGSYIITVTANGSVSGSKVITVTAGPNCSEENPNPVISDQVMVECGSTHTYTVADSKGGPVNSVSWQGSLGARGSEQSATVKVPTTPGTYTITATINGDFTTTKTVTVKPGGGACT